MILFNVEHEKLSNFLLKVDKDIQKGMRKAVNSGNRAAHREGYKILSKSYKIERDEYKKRSTKIKSIKLSDFAKNKDLTANIKAKTKGIGLLRFAVNKTRTPMKLKRRNSRRPVVVNLAGKNKTVKNAFIARPKNDKHNHVFSKNKRNGKWKWKREETKSLYQLMTEEETQRKLEEAADRVVKRILDKELKPLL